MSARRMLMAVRGTGQRVDAEPVVAHVTGDGRLVLELDEGERLELEWDDLLDLAESAAPSDEGRAESARRVA